MSNLSISLHNVRKINVHIYRYGGATWRGIRVQTASYDGPQNYEFILYDNDSAEWSFTEDPHEGAQKNIDKPDNAPLISQSLQGKA